MVGRQLSIVKLIFTWVIVPINSTPINSTPKSKIEKIEKALFQAVDPIKHKVQTGSGYDQDREATPNDVLSKRE